MKQKNNKSQNKSSSKQLRLFSYFMEMAVVSIEGDIDVLGLKLPPTLGENWIPYILLIPFYSNAPHIFLFFFALLFSFFRIFHPVEDWSGTGSLIPEASAIAIIMQIFAFIACVCYFLIVSLFFSPSSFL